MSDIISVSIPPPTSNLRGVILPTNNQILAQNLLTPTTASDRKNCTMSKEYEGQDPIAIAKQAERDLNSHQAKHGVSNADSSKNIRSSLSHHSADTT